MNIRLAEAKDIKQLIKMRWDFTVEDNERIEQTLFNDFEKECQIFFRKCALQ